MRVVSLVPSVTETLLAWGIEPVAVTRFCEQPLLRHVGGTKDPDIAAIVALEPDLVVMDEEENRLPDAEALRAAGVALHVTAVRSMADVPPALVDLARAVGAAAPSLTVGSVQSTAPVRRRAFVPIWRRPWMTINRDTYGSSLLGLIGVENVFADHADRYPTVTPDELGALAPDVVLAPSEPYPFRERHLGELRSFAADVRLIDGRDLFWWGVRTPGAVERVAAAIA